MQLHGLLTTVLFPVLLVFSYWLGARLWKKLSRRTRSDKAFSAPLAVPENSHECADAVHRCSWKCAGWNTNLPAENGSGWDRSLLASLPLFGAWRGSVRQGHLSFLHAIVTGQTGWTDWLSRNNYFLVLFLNKTNYNNNENPMRSYNGVSNAFFTLSRKQS